MPCSQALRGWLDRPLDPLARKPARFQARKDWPDWLRDADFFPLRDVVRAETRLKRRVANWDEGMFFHCSHAQLDKPERFRWLEKSGVRSTFFLHDAIPIEFPEFCSPGAFDRHVKRLTTVSAHATLAVVNSQDSRRAVAAALAERRMRAPDIEIVPLAVDEAFVAKVGASSAAAPGDALFRLCRHHRAAQEPVVPAGGLAPAGRASRRQRRPGW